MSIFKQSDNTPIKFFIETSAVRERPRLVRSIVANGGQIVSSAQNADILLAENDTREAVEVLDAWGEDKLVLSTRWAWRCIQEMVFLGIGTNWGGCVLDKESIMSGLDMEEDEVELEEEYKPVRKRARETPSSNLELSTQSYAQQAVAGLSDVRTPPMKRQKVGGQEEKASTPQTSHPSPNIQMQPSPVTSQAGIATGTAQPNLLVQQALLTAMLSQPTPTQQPSPSQQALLTAMLSQPTPTQPPSPSQQDLSTMAASFNTLLPILTQTVLGHTLAASNNNTQFNPQVLLSQLLGQPLLSQQSATPPSIPTSEDHISPASPTRSPSSQGGPSSCTDRIHTPQTLQPLYELEVSEPSELTPVSSPLRSLGRRRGKSPEPIPPRPLPPPPPSQDKGIFMNDFGNPRQFFVMAPMKCFNRREVLKLIRKHGGEIVERMTQADHIILDKPSRDTFKDFLRMYEQVPEEKVALSPFWIEECDKRGEKIDMAKFILDVTSIPEPKKKGQNRSLKTDGSPSTPSPSRAVEQAPERTAPNDCESVNTREHIVAQPIRRNVPSRSPSPPSNMQKLPKSQNLYTQEDADWFLRYIRCKIQQNPDISRNDLMEAVGHKAPHHSARSWDAYCRRKHEDKYNDIRKEVMAQLLRDATTESEVVQEMVRVKDEPGQSETVM